MGGGCLGNKQDKEKTDKKKQAIRKKQCSGRMQESRQRVAVETRSGFGEGLG